MLASKKISPSDSLSFSLSPIPHHIQRLLLNHGVYIRHPFSPLLFIWSGLAISHSWTRVGVSIWSSSRKVWAFGAPLNPTQRWERVFTAAGSWIPLAAQVIQEVRSLRVSMNQEMRWPSSFLAWIEGSSTAIYLSLSACSFFFLIYFLFLRGKGVGLYVTIFTRREEKHLHTSGEMTAWTLMEVSLQGIKPLGKAKYPTNELFQCSRIACSVSPFNCWLWELGLDLGLRLERVRTKPISLICFKVHMFPLSFFFLWLDRTQWDEGWVPFSRTHHSPLVSRFHFVFPSIYIYDIVVLLVWYGFSVDVDQMVVIN